MEYVPDLYKTKTMCDKAVDRKSYALTYAPDEYKAQKIIHRNYSL